MPSGQVTKALGALDLEHDQRDWIGQFPVEFESERRGHSLRRKSETLFTVVQYGRPQPIVLPPPSRDSETQSSSRSSRHHYSLTRRVKRAISPALTALFSAYVAVVFITAWLGVRRGEASRKGDAIAPIAAATDGLGPANRP